jgi:hypothetical protein
MNLLHPTLVLFTVLFTVLGSILIPTSTSARPAAPSSPAAPASSPTAAQSPDIPEELLRTEIITTARSPLNGEPLTAAEYAQLQETLRDRPPLYSDVSPNIRSVVRLLYIRRAIRSVFPFLLQSR